MNGENTTKRPFARVLQILSNNCVCLREEFACLQAKCQQHDPITNLQKPTERSIKSTPNHRSGKWAKWSYRRIKGPVGLWVPICNEAMIAGGRVTPAMSPPGNLESNSERLPMQISPCPSNQVPIRNTCPPKYPTELEQYPTGFTPYRTRLFQNSTSLAFQREHRAVSNCNPHRVCVASSMADPSAEPRTSCDSNMGARHWCPWCATPF